MVVTARFAAFVEVSNETSPAGHTAYQDIADAIATMTYEMNDD